MNIRRFFLLNLYGVVAGAFYSVLLYGADLLPLIISIVGACCIVTIYSFIESIKYNVTFRNSSFRKKLLLSGSLYTFLIATGLIILLIISLFAVNREESFSEKIVSFLAWLNSKNAAYIILYSFIAGFASQMILLLKNKNSIELLSGKYENGLEELRTFMTIKLIIDKDSEVNENLSLRSKMLSTFLIDNENLIAENKAEYYRIEDEMIILSWQPQFYKENESCVSLFWNLAKHIQSHKKEYLIKYGTIPKINAAVHCGNILISEMGLDERELVYNGATLINAKDLLLLHSIEENMLVLSAAYLKHLPEENRHELQQNQLISSNKITASIKFEDTLINSN